MSTRPRSRGLRASGRAGGRAGLVAGLALVGALSVGCGTEDPPAGDASDTSSDTPSGTSSTDPGQDPTTDPTATPSAATVTDLLPGPNAGGTVDPAVTILATAADVQDFVAQFGTGTLASDVIAAVGDPADHAPRRIGAAVIALGCDVPPSATVTEDADGYVVVPGKITAPMKECLVPTTTVAIVDLPPDGG